MGYIINTTDFVGQWHIAQGSFSQLGNFITQFEKGYLYKLMGKTQADEFIDDLTNYVPVTQKYLDIYNPINYELSDGCFLVNDGMKNMMLGFIWFEYMRYTKAQSTISGNVANANENSREVGFTELNIGNRYNDAIQSFKVIQEYCLEDEITYPDFEGVKLDFSHWAI